MSVQGAGYAYDPYYYPPTGPQHQGPGLGQTSQGHSVVPGGFGVPAAAPPKKESGGGGLFGGFFKKVAATVRGVTKIPGNIFKAAVDTLTDPGKLLKTALLVGGAALLGPVGWGALALYGVYKGGQAVAQGGGMALQGWLTGDLNAIENGTATAGTGAIVGAASVYGLRANANSVLGAGAAKGLGVRQNIGIIRNEGGQIVRNARGAYSGAGGGVNGLRAAGENLYNGSQLQSVVNGVRGRAGNFRAGGGNTTSGTQSGGRAYTRPDLARTDNLLARQNFLNQKGGLTPQELAELGRIETVLAGRGVTQATASGARFNPGEIAGQAREAVGQVRSQLGNYRPASWNRQGVTDSVQRITDDIAGSQFGRFVQANPVESAVTAGTIATPETVNPFAQYMQAQGAVPTHGGAF